MIAVSLAAQLGTAPLIAFYFGRVSTIFAVSSLIAVPCTMLIVSASFCLLLLSPLPSLSSFIGEVYLCCYRRIEYLTSLACGPTLRMHRGCPCNRFPALYILFHADGYLDFMEFFSREDRV